MESVVANLRSTFVLLASMLGFAAQAAAYVPLPGAADHEVVEVATEDVYRTPPPDVVIAPRAPAPVLVVDAPRVRRASEGQAAELPSWREALRLEREHERPRLASAVEHRRPRDRELSRAAANGDELVGGINP